MDPEHTQRLNLNPLREVWRERASRYGKRCVINLSIPEKLYDKTTLAQISSSFPILKAHLNGSERFVLDYGCGPGRFTPALADAIRKSQVIGYDPCAELLRYASYHPHVRYASGPVQPFLSHRMRSGKLFDVIWITLVFGGLPEETVVGIAAALEETLAPNGLLFLAEHISETPAGSDFWKFRPKRFYCNAFKNVALEQAGVYTVLNDEITTLVGRKRSIESSPL